MREINSKLDRSASACPVCRSKKGFWLNNKVEMGTVIEMTAWLMDMIHRINIILSMPNRIFEDSMKCLK